MVMQPLPHVHVEPAATWPGKSSGSKREVSGGHWHVSRGVCESWQGGEETPTPCCLPRQGMSGNPKHLCEDPSTPQYHTQPWGRVTISIWEQEVGGEVQGATGASPEHGGAGGCGAGS